jgi:hypothetical protein
MPALLCAGWTRCTSRMACSEISAPPHRIARFRGATPNQSGSLAERGYPNHFIHAGTVDVFVDDATEAKIKNPYFSRIFVLAHLGQTQKT